MLGIRKLVFWMVVLLGGYHGLDYVKIHTSGDVVSYKRFAKAVMNSDVYSARMASNPDLVEEVLSAGGRRHEQYKGRRVLFTYYNVLSQSLSPDGKNSTLIVEQISRVDSTGEAGLFGDSEIRVRHTAQLVYENFLWKVTDFRDPAMR